MRSTLLRTGAVALAAVIGLSLTASAAAGTSTSDLPAPTQTAPVTGVGNGDPTSAHPPTLVGVRVGRHDEYDRTVFDFVGGTPNYVVRYAPLTNEGRGDPVPLAGAASLLVRFEGAFAYDINTGASTINLAQVLNPEYPTLRQVRFGGAFEGYISAGLGLRDRVGFRVFQLHGPERVVVDVAHQPDQPFGTDTFWGGAGTADIVDISGVRAGSHPGYDRLVFDLRGTGATPLIFAGYVRGQPTTLNVGLTGLTTNPAVISGPPVTQFGLANLRSVSFTAYENGSVSARVQTLRRNGFRVMLLSNPTRLVLDVAT